MEIATEGAPSTSGDTSSVTNGRSRRRWGIGLASVLLLAGLVAIIAVFAGKANKKVQTHLAPATPGDTTILSDPLTLFGLNKAEEAPAASASGSVISAPVVPVTTPSSSSETENAVGPGMTKATNAAGDFAMGIANKLPGQEDQSKLAGNLALAAAKLSDGATKMVSDGGTCVANDYDELKDAIENQTCKMVLLQAGTRYEIEEEIWIRRRVVVMGNPSILPVLDGEEAVRTFHVAAGGFLELRFVQITMSDGIFRDAYSWEFATSPDGKVNEIRGGSVMFDAGAAGGIFTGVFFVDDPDIEKGLQRNIRRTLNRETYRIYGGHVFAAGGEIDFIGCLFFDLTVLYAFGNALFIGADVLQLGGVLTFTGCVFLENTIIGVENGVGLFVAQFAGLSTYTFNTFDENNFAVMENCMAQAFLVVGGVMVMTASNINEMSGAITYTGTGELNVLGGVLVLTGVANTEVFALGATFGVGFEYTVGGGVIVITGSPFNEFNGLYYFAALGEVSFVGGGLFLSTGSPTIEYVSQASENGQGGAVFIGGGYGSWIGTPTLEFIGIATVHMLGEYIAVDAGFIVWVASPVIEGSVLEFQRQLGSVIYVGAGAMVLYATPLIEWYGPYVTRTTEFWVMGTCESEGGGTITDGTTAGGQEGERRARSLTTSQPRNLYTIPTFVAPMQGCQKIVDFFYGIEKGNDGAGGGEGERRARALSSKPRPAAASAATSTRKVPKQKAITGPRVPVGIGGSSRRALPRAAGPRRKLTTKERELRTFFKQGGHTQHLPGPVRRHATSLWHKDGEEALKPEQDGRSLASAVNPLDISLLARDVTRVTEMDRNKLKRLVPDAWLDNIDKMQAQIRSMHDGDQFPDDKDRPAFNIDSPTSGYCGLCNVPGATGAGLSSCQYEEDCKNLQLPNNVTLKTTEEEDELKYDKHYLIMSTISATTDSSVETLDLTELQEAVVAAVAEVQGANTDKEAVVVNLYTGELDPQFGDMFEAPARSLFESDVFAKTHTVKMVLLATSASTMNLIKASLDGNDDINLEGRLAQNIRAAFAALSGIELGHVGITNDKEIYVPAYNSVEHVNGPHRSLGTHSMVLVDPDIPAVPTTHVKYGKTYHVHLENFPANSEVQVDLLKFKDNHEEEHVSHLVRHLVTDEEGHATVDFEFSNIMEPADYFFQAKAGSGEVGYSQGYDLSHQGQARRLYGTHMWI